MKKLYLLLSLTLFAAGCTMSNTPTSKVEELLTKYQNNDSEITAQLDSVVSSDEEMSDIQKKEYKKVMEKQYQNMSYKIKNETIEKDKAIVEVEIEVYDYATSIDKSKAYYEANKEEFTKTEDETKEIKNYVDYKISELKKVSDKKKYTINFNLTKKDKDWVVEDLTDADIQKLHGLYK